MNEGVRNMLTGIACLTAAVLVVLIGCWCGVRVTQSNDTRKSIVAEQCRDIQDEALRVSCLRDAG